MMSKDQSPPSSSQLMQMEYEKAAHNYHCIPVVFSKAKGIYVWDPEGNRYYDFLSAYSALNQGHCHPKIIKALNDQAQSCTLSSRAFYNNVFPQFANHITKLLNYDRVLPMNTGVEAVETAIKVARKWSYEKKGVPDGEAILINCTGCFHGRTLAAVSMSDDKSAYEGFGPFLPGFVSVPFGDSEALERVLLEKGDKVAGFLVEPIQGEAGVIVPPEGYLKKCYDLCKKHSVLFIADEVQTGLCRTGKMLACDYEDVHPDVLILGKALGGGVLPVSCVLSNSDIMLKIKPGEHGSTFGGNPLSSAVAIASLEVLIEEKLADRAFVLGERLRNRLNQFKQKFPFIKTVRGKGLLSAIVIDSNYSKNAWELCMIFKKNGLLAKPTHEDIIRLAPALVMTEEQLGECIEILEGSFSEFWKN